MLIKVCGLREPSNIADILWFKPEYIGLNFVPDSIRALNPTIPFSLPENAARFIGVFRDPTHEEVISTVTKWGLQGVQLHGRESPEFCKTLKDELPQIEVFKAFEVSAGRVPVDSIMSYHAIDNVLLDSSLKGGTGMKFDWELLEGFKSRKKVFLSGGISLGDLSKIRKLKGIDGVDINSRFEVEPGVKDPELIGEFIQGLRENNGKV